jgi:hypothetical protein
LDKLIAFVVVIHVDIRTKLPANLIVVGVFDGHPISPLTSHAGADFSDWHSAFPQIHPAWIMPFPGDNIVIEHKVTSARIGGSKPADLATSFQVIRAVFQHGIFIEDFGWDILHF